MGGSEATDRAARSGQAAAPTPGRAGERAGEHAEERAGGATAASPEAMARRHRRRTGVAALGVGVGLVATAGVWGVGVVAGPHAATPAASAASGTGGAMPPVADLEPMRQAFGSPVTLPARAQGAAPTTDAGITARLALENGCLVARTGEGDRIVVWRAGTTARLVDGMVTVFDADGQRVAEVGDPVTVATGTTTPATTGTSQCRPPAGARYVDAVG